MIKISKNGVEFTYDNVNKACRENGATSGYNIPAGLKYLAKCGFDVSSLVQEEGTKGSTSKPRETILQKLINICSVVDQKQIDTLNARILKIMHEFTMGDELTEIDEINAKIKLLSNPVVTVDLVKSKIDEMWLLEMTPKTETPETPETPKEETPETPKEEIKKSNKKVA